MLRLSHRQSLGRPPDKANLARCIGIQSRIRLGARHQSPGQTSTRRYLHLAPPFLLDDYIPRYQTLSSRDAAKKRSQAYAHLRNCNLCPRLCGVNRYETTGMCLIGDKAKVNVIAPHFGEGGLLSLVLFLLLSLSLSLFGLCVVGCYSSSPSLLGFPLGLVIEHSKLPMFPTQEPGYHLYPLQKLR